MTAMTLRVTFDTNVLDLACRPERFSKDPRQPRLGRVRQALQDREILGFYPVTMLTIEGVQNADRAAVFGSTTTTVVEGPPATTRAADLPSDVRARIGNRDIETIPITIRTSQPRRMALHPEVVRRMAAAKALGVRVLKAPPRIGAFRIDDPIGEYYLPNGEGDALAAWIDAVQAAGRAIEQRGLGYAQVRALGQTLAARSPEELWFRALEQAKDIHEQRSVQRAFSEWADGDALASHVAYGIDVFCSADVGNTNAQDSILDPTHRAWLTATYGVQFATFDDLLATLS
jgi:hypothetical protein